jgi:glycerophosphoryl diester phosphodiesterase
MTLAEVRALDAGRWFGDEFEGQRITELPAFLSWIEARPGFGAALEVKAAGIGQAVAQLAWASPARDRLAIYAFDPAEIRAAEAATPELPCVLLLYLDADPGGVRATIDTDAPAAMLAVVRELTVSGSDH